MKYDKIKRVIVWGNFSGSFRYIHSAYFNAFKSLGYETYWINDITKLNITDISDTLFLVEDQDKSGLPIRKDCYYILHHINNEPFLSVGAKIVNLCNFIYIPCNQGISWNYPMDPSAGHGSAPMHPVEKIKDYVFYDRKNLAIYQPWATNILPENIGELSPFDPNINEINFVGSIWSENVNQTIPFLEKCHYKNITINLSGWLQFPELLRHFPLLKQVADCGGATEDMAKTLVQKSLIYPDIRGDHHTNLGYLPCRIFKNISYGCIPVTNSKYVSEFFENLIPYSNNTADFLDISINYLNNRDIEKDQYLVNKIKTEHTYINRVNDLMEYIKELYE